MVSFNNTEIAFAHKSNRELKRAFYLFKMLGFTFLVKWSKPLVHLAFTLRLPIKGLIKKTIFAQFCGGENIEQSLKAIDELSQHNVKGILDYSVEGKTEERNFEETTQEIVDTLLAGQNRGDIPFAVFKLTGITRFDLLQRLSETTSTLTEKEKREKAALLERVELICTTAHRTGTPILIDAEESWIQPAIDEIAYHMMLKFNHEKAVVYNTIQMYRHDRLAHLKNQLQWARQHGIYFGVKLVRGAYMEKERSRAERMGYPSPIQEDKSATDRDFNEGMRLLLDHIDFACLCAGSHNEESNLLLTVWMQERGIPTNHPHLYFAQLLGMSDHISFNLAHHGFSVAKYVPYGPIKEVLPYLIRRAEENTSVAGQTGRELSLIIKEMNRRKQGL